MNPHARRMVAAGATVGVLVLGYALTRSLRWYCDDIFITLRYVENFLNGHGLVYNVGERVEGFTHFLWLVVLALCQRLGMDPVAAAVNLGLASFLLVLALFALVSYRAAPRELPLVLPVTSLALVANRESRIWATSGLETAFFTLLLSLTFVVAFFTGIRRTRRVFLAGLLLALAVLTRPDALLFWGVGLVFVAGRMPVMRVPARETLREVAVYVLPFLVTAVPYQIFRVLYYGDFFPNPYYAKSAGLAYWSQGFYYLGIYFKAHPTSLLFLAAVPVLIAGAVRRRGQGPGASPRSGNGDARLRSAALAALVAVVVYLVLFVARVGGGFMYARFIVPVLPFVYFLVEWSLGRLGRRRGYLTVAVLLAVPAVVGTLESTWRDDLLLEPGEGRREIRHLRGILDEHAYYTMWYPIQNDRWVGSYLRPYVSGLDLTVLLRGQACFGYYAGFKTCIENNGLTDRTIARLPLESRHRMGHEKSAPYAYMLERGVNFVFQRAPYRDRPYRFARFDLPGGMQVRAEIITYDAAVMQELSRRMEGAFQFAPFDRLLDRYIQEALPNRSREQREEDYREFKEYYFDHTDDPARQTVLEDALGGGG